MTSVRRLPIALGAAAALAWSFPAWGYVRTTANSGHPLHWGKRSLGATLFSNYTPPGLDRGIFVRAVRAAANTWSSTSQSCTNIQLGLLESEDFPPAVEADGQSSVAFVLKGWPYDASVIALTSVFSRNSVISDADVELNGVDQRWSDVVLEGTKGRQDVQNVLTHEFGHFLGFSHTCYTVDQRDLGRPVDHHGRPVPDCESAPAEVLATTMFPSADVGDTSKRDLTSDDIQGLCDVYNEDPPGCAVSGRRHARGAGAVVALAALGMLALRRRRRQ